MSKNGGNNWLPTLSSSAGVKGDLGEPLERIEDLGEYCD
jgi:hypothetical protein